jgi:hypothetical protein
MYVVTHPRGQKPPAFFAHYTEAHRYAKPHPDAEIRLIRADELTPTLGQLRRQTLVTQPKFVPGPHIEAPQPMRPPLQTPRRASFPVTTPETMDGLSYFETIPQAQVLNVATTSVSPTAPHPPVSPFERPPAPTLTRDHARAYAMPSRAPARKPVFDGDHHLKRPSLADRRGSSGLGLHVITAGIESPAPGDRPRSPKED